jgi:hypothetical protein
VEQSKGLAGEAGRQTVTDVEREVVVTCRQSGSDLPAPPHKIMDVWRSDLLVVRRLIFVVVHVDNIYAEE